MSNITLLRLKHTAKLEKLIREGAPYKKILRESRIVDQYIAMEMQQKMLENSKLF